jgi:hypothetical protein
LILRLRCELNKPEFEGVEGVEGFAVGLKPKPQVPSLTKKRSWGE